MPLLADITDGRRIERIFAEHRPHVVFHAAAHKHVPMMEHNAGEAVKNNVFGTKMVADAALAAGCRAFVLISTDKAVNPTSVMGATKRVAEVYCQSLNEAKRTGRGRTRFVAVRFGNVLGSSGSVVPIWAKQIAAGGPVTVTHPDMQRFFMTIPEASQLVMQAGAIGAGGEIFVLDMGEPVKVVDLAREMIRRSGRDDIDIKFSGIRPGEKLYEELAGATEATRPTAHAKIHVWQLPVADPAAVARSLETLRQVADAPGDVVKQALCDAVPEYTGLPKLRLAAA